jgi:hypothetical protein
MKLVILSISILTLLLTSCATPNEPNIDSEQEKLTYETIQSTAGYVYDIVLHNDMIFAAEDQAGLSIYNMNGVKIDSYYVNNISARAIHVSSADSLIYLFNRNGSPAGLTVFHLSTLLQEVIFNIYGNTSSLKDIFTLNNETLKVFWSGGTTISSSFFNQDLNWWEAGMGYNFPAPIYKIDASEDKLYVAGSQIGIFVTDIATSAILKTIDTPGEARDVKFVDNTLFVACQEEGFEIIDISNLENPVLVFRKNTVGYAQSVSVENSILAIGSGGGGVYVYDISSLSNPVFLGRITSAKIGYTFVVTVHNNFIYAGTKTGIFKISIKN